LAPFVESVVDDDEAGEGVGPPPLKCGVGDEADQDGGGKVGVDEGDAGFGLEDAVVQCLAGAGFAGGEREHDGAGDGGPGDPKGGGLGVVGADEGVGGLGGDVDGQRDEGDADQA
jgi:hypothetical protein